MQQRYEMNHTSAYEDQQSCRLIETVCFVVFLPIALVARLGGWRWHPWPAGPKGYGSVVGEARSMARIVTGIAVSV